MKGFHCEFWPVVTSDGHNFALLSDQDYTDANGDKYRIPASTAKTDGGSVPRALWNLYPPFGPEWKAYVLHDAAYQDTLLKAYNGIWIKATLSKRDCDNLLWNALTICGVDCIRKASILTAVKAYGHSAFEEDRKQCSVG